MIDRLLSYMSLFAQLQPRDRQLLTGSAEVTVRSFAKGAELLRPGERPAAVQFLLAGIGCRYTILLNGRRQITALLLPGDVVGLGSLLQWACSDTVMALTSIQCLQIPAHTAASCIGKQAPLGQAMWGIRELQTAIYREWVTNLGTRPAVERIAHFFCETLMRARVLGISTGSRCALPMTQIELADVTALTPVHVNRILTQLRSAGLARFKRGLLDIPDLGALQAFSRFDARYLHPLQNIAPAPGVAPSLRHRLPISPAVPSLSAHLL